MKALHKKVDYISAHQQEFGIEDLYALDIFKSFVEMVENTADNCLLESGCKIERDRLHAARFTVAFDLKTRDRLKTVFDFFDRVNARDDIQIDRSLIEKFFTVDFDFSKIQDFWVGVDLRRELLESSLDIALTIEDYPEKQELAIALNGKHLEEDTRTLLVNSSLHMGFDFGFNGKSNIELYPFIKEPEWQRIDIRQRLIRVLSPVALQPLPICKAIFVGISQANSAKKIYYFLEKENFNDLFTYFPANDIARRVHAYYQDKPLIRMAIALLESELQAGTIQRMNLYYHI